MDNFRSCTVSESLSFVATTHTAHSTRIAMAAPAVFISHAWKDKTVVEKIYAGLRRFGVRLS